MKPLRPLLLCMLLVAACSCNASADPSRQTGWVLVGSTPGDSIIKSILDIPQRTPIDFIRWRMDLGRVDAASDSFQLDISFGLSKPNTLGFADDHGEKSYRGTYTVSDPQATGVHGRIFQLTSPSLGGRLSVLQLDENVFHLLQAGNRLICGNGGWSYTLNRSIRKDVGQPFAAAFASGSLFNDTARAVTFDGRTPCTIARDYDFGASAECFKLKWRLILYRDPQSRLAGTYQINRTLSRTQLLSGRWVVRNHPHNPAARILQLDPDQPGKSLAFLIADADVLFFLDKQFSLYAGNKDFSYTMNRRSQ